MGEGLTFRIGRFPVQTLLNIQPGLGTQPRYNASGVLWVGISKTQWSTPDVEAAPSAVAQIWLWGSQIADKK